MYDLKDWETSKTGLKYTEAVNMVKKDPSLIMRRVVHFITLIKSKGGGKKIYGYGFSKRAPKNVLGRYWLTPLVSKSGGILYTIEPALHSVGDVSVDDMFKEDWEVLFVKRWNDVSIGECE